MRRATAAVLLVLAASCGPARTAPHPPAGGAAEAGGGERVTLVRITDGDTIRVDAGGREERVRLIGIDTPERDECYFREATEHLRSLLEERPLTMVRDVSDRDRYGRLLRYLYVDGRFVNALMVRDGYASAATYPPDVAHAPELVAAEREARLAGRGLWAPGACRR